MNDDNETKILNRFDGKVMSTIQEQLTKCKLEIEQMLEEMAKKYNYDLAYWGYAIHLSFELRPGIHSERHKAEVVVDHKSIFEEEVRNEGDRS